MKKRKRIKYMIIPLVLAFISVVSYNIYDNNRINVVEQIIELDNLPKEFDDFKILQITDLHEKSFGKNQKDLIDTINKLNYDIIVVTGDIVNKETADINPFKKLISGIRKKDLIFFVAGNNDPNIYYRNRLTVFGQELKNVGCELLDKPYLIKRGKNNFWIMKYIFSSRYNDELYEKINENDIKVALNHYPISEDTYKMNSLLKGIKYDLIIAGHYHGGQVRIPFLGALYVPKGGIKSFFPNQNEVSGFEKKGYFKQYVSRGLGASGPKFIAYRVFDTPEINLLTLKKKSK